MNTHFNSTSISFPFQRFLMDNSSLFPSSSSFAINTSKLHQKPRKKRSKMIRFDRESVTDSKPKYRKKPDPTAPKITRPCSECGKKFWSWKALFGHMRCHPERQWRGINPPLNLRRVPISVSPVSFVSDFDDSMTEEDQDIADCLIMLSNGDHAPESDGASFRFECSSCKKVFGSHQALGGHRASHKNVKGCFAITRSDEEIEENSQNVDSVSVSVQLGHEMNLDLDEKMVMVLGTMHKCSICMRVFSSGQALGGHKRRHWERVEESTATENCAILDLNKPAPIEEDDDSSYSSGLTLDLRLGL